MNLVSQTMRVIVEALREYVTGCENAIDREVALEVLEGFESAPKGYVVLNFVKPEAVGDGYFDYRIDNGSPSSFGKLDRVGAKVEEMMRRGHT